MKLLIDMNLSPKFVDLMLKKGVDAVHWTEIGAPDARDTEIMEYACKNDYIIMTCDLDFNILLAIAHSLKPSVVQLRAHMITLKQDGDWIAAAVIQNADALEKGAILSADTKKYRLRLLPI